MDFFVKDNGQKEEQLQQFQAQINKLQEELTKAMIAGESTGEATSKFEELLKEKDSKIQSQDLLLSQMQQEVADTR